MGTSVGPSPTSQLVQTIFNLKELQLRQQAAALAQQQFGLQQEQVHANIGATHEAQVAQLGQILQQTQDPQALLEHVPELSQQTGYSEGLLKTLIQNTKPSVETTKAGVVSRGVASAGAALEQPAAYAATVGALPGQVSADATQKELMDHATEYYKSLQPAQRQQFDQEVLQRSANGQTPGQAAIDMAIAGLPKDKLRLAAEVGAQIAPSAAQDAQIRLGYAQVRQREREITAESADRRAALYAGLAKAQQEGKDKGMTEVNKILHDMSQFEMDAQKNSSTFTREGKLQYNAQINAYIEQLKQAAPQIYGPGGIYGPKGYPQMPLDATISPESFWKRFVP